MIIIHTITLSDQVNVETKNVQTDMTTVKPICRLPLPFCMPIILSLLIDCVTGIASPLPSTSN